MKQKIFALFFVLIVFVFFCIFSVTANGFFYPKKYLDVVEVMSDKYDIESALIYAIIKSESDFVVDAKSRVGAMGLMQLRPSTAQYIADKIGYKKSINLFSCECNIELGTAYLSYLFEIFGEQRKVICAYNAGEGIIRLWTKNSVRKNFEIQYDETRVYYQKVIFAYNVYKSKF